MAAPIFVADEVVTAAKMNSLPKGVLGYAQVTANQTGITAEADLTGLSVTVDVAASRRVKITGFALFAAAASPNTRLFIKESTTQFNAAAVTTPGGSGATLVALAVVTPSSGSHTYKLAASSSTTADMIASATRASFILVEDIGGV